MVTLVMMVTVWKGREGLAMQPLRGANLYGQPFPLHRHLRHVRHSFSGSMVRTFATWGIAY